MSSNRTGINSNIKEPRFMANRFLAIGMSVIALTGLSILGLASPSHAAEKLVLTYGSFGRSITVEELENFVATGEKTSTLRFLLKTSRQNPEAVRAALSKEVTVSPQLLDDLLNTLPGEYALFMAGRIFHTPARRSNDKALRSTILLSTADDRKVSILELLKNYPTQAVFLDGYRLASTAKDVSRLVGQVEADLKGPIAIMTDLFNGVICQCEQPPGPNSPINAN